MQRSIQANEDLVKIKKQVEQLPGIIEHELNSNWFELTLIEIN